MPGAPGAEQQPVQQRVQTRFTSPTYSGSHGRCMLWKLRLNSMLTLANVSPREKAASTEATAEVSAAVNASRWNTRG